MTSSHVIAILGGTGAQGRGLGVRFAAAGHAVVLGSRDRARADCAAEGMQDLLPPDAKDRVSAATNAEAAAQADVILVATPWDDSPTSHAWLSPLATDKVVISCVNPLGFDKSGPFGLAVSAGSAAEHLARQLPEARVAGAFHHVAAGRLADLRHSLDDEDVLVASDDLTALRITCDLARSVSRRRGIDAGPLRVCRQLEPWTAVLIGVNKNYTTHSGIALRNVTRDHSKRVPESVG